MLGIITNGNKQELIELLVLAQKQDGKKDRIIPNLEIDAKDLEIRRFN